MLTHSLKEIGRPHKNNEDWTEDSQRQNQITDKFSNHRAMDPIEKFENYIYLLGKEMRMEDTTEEIHRK